MVTASHNPMDYNGMKLVRGGAIPVSGDTGFARTGGRCGGVHKQIPAGVARKTPISQRQSYVEHLLGYVEAGQAETTEDRGQCGEWLSRAGDRRTGIAAALRVR